MSAAMLERVGEVFGCCPCRVFKTSSDGKTERSGRYRSHSNDGAEVEPADPATPDPVASDPSQDIHNSGGTSDAHVHISVDDAGLDKTTVTSDDAEEAFRARFSDMAGVDGEIDAYELRNILNQNFLSGSDLGNFSIDECRSIVALGDPDLSGKLNSQEASLLFHELQNWTKLFNAHDPEQTGYIQADDMGSVMTSSGLEVNGNSCYKAIATRYSDRHGQIQYHDFTLCMAKLTAMNGIYKNKLEEDGGRCANFTLDEFIHLTMYS